jgi:SpoVK/Ycf46/Vps4 family AAA+-type ATPase
MKEAKEAPLLRITGLPKDASPEAAAVFRSRLFMAARALVEDTNATPFSISLTNGGNPEGEGMPKETRDARKPLITSRYPLYTFDQLVLPRDVLEDLLAAVDIFNVYEKVFGDWGLSSIEPNPKVALSLHGPPGTGKTLAAHAIAHRLSRRIQVASYADIESKFHGDGPKNVQAMFAAAEASGAVLFIDEADSLLSKRLTRVNHGSEQAINSMRSQLLICLESFTGVAIFCTNMAGSYDKAFETRIRHVAFPKPDATARAAIWLKHLVAKLPLAEDVDSERLGREIEDLCGRDIRNAVIDAAVRAALASKELVAFADLEEAAHRILDARLDEQVEVARKATPELTQRIRAAVAGREVGQSEST